MDSYDEVIMDQKPKWNIFKRGGGKRGRKSAREVADRRKGKYVLRTEYTDLETGKQIKSERQFSRHAEATDARDKWLLELQKTGGKSIKGQKMTFAQLVEHCKEKIYQPAATINETYLDGRRSPTLEYHLAPLLEYFEDYEIGRIKTEHLHEYRRWRLEMGSRHPKRKGQPISLASTNRELTVMRRMMRYALNKENWITQDIFREANVIVRRAERARHRRATDAEVTRLLACCQGEREVTYERTRKNGKKEKVTMPVKVDNPRLKAIILMALDTGMRRSEILKLRWRDIDLNEGIIYVDAANTKTLEGRIVGITDRLRDELITLNRGADNERPFPFSNINRSFKTACRLAGIDDLHFHDLRANAVTQWQRGGVSTGIASKMAGHSNVATTLQYYTRADIEVVREVTAKMNAAQSIEPLSSPANEFVN